MSLKTFLKDRVEKNCGVDFTTSDLDVGYAETSTLKATPPKIAILTVMGDERSHTPARLAIGMYDAYGIPSLLGVLEFPNVGLNHAGDILARAYALLFEMDDDYFEPAVGLKTVEPTEVEIDVSAAVYAKLNEVYTKYNQALPPLTPEQHGDSDPLELFAGGELREAIDVVSRWLRSVDVGATRSEVASLFMEDEQTLTELVEILEEWVADADE